METINVDVPKDLKARLDALGPLPQDVWTRNITSLIRDRELLTFQVLGVHWAMKAKNAELRRIVSALSRRKRSIANNPVSLYKVLHPDHRSPDVIDVEEFWSGIAGDLAHLPTLDLKDGVEKKVAIPRSKAKLPIVRECLDRGYDVTCFKDGHLLIHDGSARSSRAAFIEGIMMAWDKDRSRKKRIVKAQQTTICAKNI